MADQPARPKAAQPVQDELHRQRRQQHAQKPGHHVDAGLAKRLLQHAGAEKEQAPCDHAAA